METSQVLTIIVSVVVPVIGILGTQMLILHRATNKRIDDVINRFDGKVDNLGENLNTRIDDINNRFDGKVDNLGENLNTRIDDINNRFDDIHKRLDDMMGLVKSNADRIDKQTARIDEINNTLLSIFKKD